MAKSKVFICLLSIVLLIHNIDASNEFLVESTTCNTLDEKSRLQFGETMAYVYEVEKSLLVKIGQEDYIICNAPSPVDVTKSGDYGYSMVKLNQVGPKYSISGIVENNKDKILIHVIAGRSRSPPAPAQAQSQAQPQTIAESEGSLHFGLAFLPCIVVLHFCLSRSPSKAQVKVLLLASVIVAFLNMVHELYKLERASTEAARPWRTF